ncbi:glycosyltransferase family 2 protein [Brevibacillus thermoruber]|uniref:Glycosyltransferase family 2 protein n=1 Tax=Brevibacillus thermoruber TaxID=33942 RepID=A0A9X3TUK2_9BACL|nr:glycosyltransferase family 2 protein [Brevibacillus thermoruber]MDA5110861.1 glycosyltransferase family 2 protein [Brevibacillus thermoruber]
MHHDTLPLVSVITPSYNQGRYIRETIESVLSQDYVNVEHIVVDGGSTDDTLEILHQYSHVGERFRFVSEPDRGQSHAVNKGLTMARGEIIGWLNSDDTYQPGAIRRAVQALQKNPDWAMVYGRAYTIDEFSQIQNACEYVEPADYQKLYHGCFIVQPAAFVRSNVFREIGGIDETLNFCMDYDLWIRIARQHTIGYIEEFLANARIHSTSKTSAQWKTVGIPEIVQTCFKHYGTVSETWKTVYQQEYPEQKIPEQETSEQETSEQETSEQETPEPSNSFEDESSLGKLPRVTTMNRYEDRWVPPYFKISVAADSQHPLQTLLLKCRLPLSPAPHAYRTNKFMCTILVNKQSAGNYVISPQSFDLVIPVTKSDKQNEIEIISSWYLSNAQSKIVSFIADEVIPLSS